ncbi:nitroreductase family protein [Alteribacillus persepolensis]|uniref:nitroreductase family protein n=1 Tax=Alteribacillus persepolensis TaxID=568899 RepID=UPI001FE20786|nr:nitroreductase family protein [Alteribacillus persepolensis]
MEFKDIIRNRREITHYQDKDIPHDAMKEVLDAAVLAPAGNSLPSREFIVVQNRDMLDHLEGASPFIPWLKEAKAAVVVTGRPDVSKYWLQDASIACSFIWLAAVDHGLGSAFGAIYHSQDEEESAKREGHVRQALSIPEDRRVVAILGLGYPASHPGKKTPPENSELVHYGTF